MAGLLLFGGIAGSFAMQAAATEQTAGVTEATAVTPDPSASQENHLKSLSKIEVTFDSDLETVNGKVSIKTLGDDEDFVGNSISLNGKVMIINLNATIETYGTYVLTIPAGTVETADGKKNEQIELIYYVGTFEPASVLPSTEKAVASLKEVTIFMTDRVGGVLDGAKLNVYKDGDKEVAYTTATIDFLNSNANEATITLADEITEYGKYTIEVPANVIFDKYYNGEDAIMSGAAGNEAFELTYQVGVFEPVSVLPAMDKAVESLKEVTIFMNDRVGGVLDGAKFNVYKDGDTEVAYTTATIDFLNSNANEATITLADELTEYGKYTIVVPAGVIFDKYYNGEDAIMSGATGNEAFELTYQVGTFEFVSALPSTEEAVASLKEVTVFMSDRVGGVLDGAKLNVYKDNETEAYTTATIDFLNSNANEVTITLAEEIKENGTYTIEVPAAVIFDKYYNGEDAVMSGATGNEAFTLTYKIDTATAISSVAANGADKVVFNLNGARLEKAVKGINIINGKKVVIRK